MMEKNKKIKIKNQLIINVYFESECFSRDEMKWNETKGTARRREIIQSGS